MSKNNSKLVKTPLTPLQYIFWLGYAVCLNSLLSQLEKNLILLMIWIHQRWLYIKAKRFPPQYCMIKIFRMSIKEVGWIEIRALTKAVFLKMLLLLLRCEWVHVYLFCSKLDDVYKGNGMFFLVINIPADIFSVINRYPTRSSKNSPPVLSSVFLFIFFLLWLLSVPSSVCLCSDSEHYFYPPHRRQRLSRGHGLCLRAAEVVLLSVFTASWLRSVVTVGEKRGRGGGEESTALLSWHRLQNNWTAYQVSPQSFNACFRPDWVESSSYFTKGDLYTVWTSLMTLQLGCAHVPVSTVKFAVGSRFWLFLFWNQFVCVDASVCADLLIFGDGL